MKLIEHIRYARYIFQHWGFRIGCFSSWHEWRGECKYGISSTGFRQLENLRIRGPHLNQATSYMPANYHMLERGLANLPKEAFNGSFVDIGCGMGRSMAVAAHHGFNVVEGIDFAAEMVDMATENLRITKQKIPALQYRISWQDLADYELPDDCSTVFLFNPFDATMMDLLIQKIETAVQRQKRNICLLYATPRYTELLLQHDFIPVYRIRKFNHLETVIFIKYAEQSG